MPSPQGSDDKPVALGTGTYRFVADGTRPVLQIDLASGPNAPSPDREKLTIELHSPMSGEVFEARTSKGRLEVDRDGRVMYFCQDPSSVSFTLFLGRSVVVSMSRKTGEVLLQSPSKMLSLEKEESSADGLGGAPTYSVRLKLE